MRAFYTLQQHVALCGTECKALLVVAGLFVAGLAATELRPAPVPYDASFYAAEDAARPPSVPVRLASLAADGGAAGDSTQAAASEEAARDGAESVGEGEQAERSGERPRMNLNAASARLLTQLPGIGPKKAEAVVAYRAEHGPFGSVAELQRVKGIGPKTLETLAPLLFVEPAEPAPPPPGVQLASN